MVDISLCMGTGCDRAKRCQRFTRLGQANPTWQSYISPEDCMAHNYCLFWEVRDGKSLAGKIRRGEMKRSYETPDEMERRVEDEERFQRTGIESYEQKLDRWREDWNREIDEALEKGW